MTEMGNIWPAGGGETGALARAPGFAPPGLGTPDAWPRSLRAVLEPMLAAKQRMFLTWGPDHILFYNDALMSSYPEQHPQAFGRPYGEYWPEQKAQFAPLIAQLNQGISLLFENMPVKARRDGVLVDRWANLSFTPLRDDEGEVAGFLCITADQTDRHLAEARERDAIQALEEKTAALEALNGSLEERIAQAVVERRLAEVALYQAQKMETIGKLTGGVAHDFNNLLQVISGNLQLLAKDVAGNERAERRIANAMQGVGRGSKLASQLLAFGRRQPLEPRIVNIGRFLHGMDDMLRRALGEAVAVETIVSGGLWNTMVDPAQMENAVLNLAINARDAMEGTGRLTIEAGNAYLDDAYVASHADVAPGQYVLLAVSDTGAGIAPEHVEQVFEPFFSTKAEGKGSGLGLSMVYGFVKQSGGHVKIYSELGEGTTIKLYLPRANAPEDTVAATVDLGEIEGGRETILVAEDDEGVRGTVVELLVGLGYRVLKANDAAGALSVIDSGVAVDLLFTDVVMPGPLKSADLARMLRARAPQIAVLFTSGYTENSIVHDGRLDAGVELLSKPYTREALARKVRAVLERRGNPGQRSG